MHLRQKRPRCPGPAEETRLGTLGKKVGVWIEQSRSGEKIMEEYVITESGWEPEEVQGTFAAGIIWSLSGKEESGLKRFLEPSL